MKPTADMTLAELLVEALQLPPMSPAMRRASAVSFAYGNCKLSNPDVTREMVEAAYDRLHPEGVD